MRYLNRTVIGGTFIGLSVLFGIFFLWPEYHEFSAMQQRVANKRAELENFQEYIANLRIVEKKLQQYEPQLAVIKDAVPQQLELPELFHLIDQIRNSSGLVLNAIAVGEPQEAFPNTSVTATSVTADFLGSYASLKRFVSDIRQSVRLLELESVLLESETQEGLEGQLKSTVVLRAYSH